MTRFYWGNRAGGDFNVGANWRGGAVPGAADNAFIAIAGTYAVTVSSDQSVRSLTLDDGRGLNPTRENHVRPRGATGPRQPAAYVSRSLGERPDRAARGALDAFVARSARRVAARH